MDAATRAWAGKALGELLKEADRLLEAGAGASPGFEDWKSRVNRTLDAALGGLHPFSRQFTELTMVHGGAIGRIGDPGSWQSSFSSNPPEEVLRRARPLLRDALGILGAASPAAAPAVTAPGLAGEAGAASALSEEGTEVAAPRAFVSYSWDSEPHKEWVRQLAARLRGQGVEVTLDRWEVAPGDKLPRFMEQAVRENDLVLVICTPAYKKKADARSGGVGYEGDIITAAMLGGGDQKKFIPILRSGDRASALPTWLDGRYYVDLSAEPYSEEQYQDLLSTLHGDRERKPPLGPAPARRNNAVRVEARTTPEEGAGPIVIKGVVVDEIGDPRNDGTPGSALYRVPFRLSRRPSAEWAERFRAVWNRPPSFSSMHRPGIASVQGDRVILDGTTIEEVQRVHRDTLLLVVRTVNDQVAQMETERRRRTDAEEARLAEHRSEVKNRAAEISFDE